MIVTWILSRIVVDAKGECEINHLYDSYKFECVEEGQKNTIVSKNQFIDYLKSFFPEMKRQRKRSSNSHQTVYQGISLSELSEDSNQNISFGDIEHGMAITSMQLISKSELKIQFQQESGCLSNGNIVYKVLTFHSDGHFAITVSGKELNLFKLSIDDTFKLNKKSVSTVFNICQSIKLCNGQRLNSSVTVSRFHTLDSWTCNGETYRSVRSITCLKAVPANSTCFTCRVCQQQIIHDNKENTCDQHTDDNMMSKETTEETIKRIFPSAPPQMINFLLTQAKNVCRSPKGRRWSKEFLVTCLQLYNRSPKSYELLQSSELLILPSKSVLILYKNSLKQEPGFDDSIFLWMHEEANRLGMDENARIGGIVFDEMSIQEDIELQKNGGVLELCGFTELGTEGDLCQILKKGSRERTMGSHILQLLFLGLNGFRFPFAHFITNSIQSSQIYGLFWKAVYLLYGYGFKVLYTCMDGAQSNRNFIHLCLGEKPEIYKTPSPFNSHPMIFIMDISHVIKKLRNNIMKSGLHKKCTRLLTLSNSLEIHWQMFVDFFNWDQQNALQIHRKLTKEHIFPDNQLKMRNYLAFDVLDVTMLSSMITYKNSLGEKGEVLDGLIEFLEQTSQLVNIFQDRRPVTAFNDNRLNQLKAVDKWFTDWENSTLPTERKKKLMSTQCHEDLHCCIRGFINLCEEVLQMKTPVYIIPALVNSDVIENIFNQQRSTFNGANNNPSALQYRKTINSIIISQNSISKKANAGRSSSARPFTVAVNRPVIRKKKLDRSGEVSSNIKVLRM